MDKDCLMFMSDKQGVFPVLARHIDEGNFNTIFKENCNYKNIFFRIATKFKLPLVTVFFDKWKKKIDKDVKTIILLDSAYNKYATRIIRKRNKNARIILYFWNHINIYSIEFLSDNCIDEFWTFDPDDAKTYNIKFNKQFYTKNIKLIPNIEENKVLFLGRAKNRKDYILNIKEELSSQGIESKMIIIEEEKDFIPYDEYLNQLSEYKVILDIVDGEQIGLTLRCMESLFFNKKLITNNLDMQNYDFYNPNNIFIIGKDDFSKIKEFINKPYIKNDEDLIKDYDFEQWLKRFGV